MSTSNTNKILHLGLGNFHRAHQAVYLHKLREQGDTSWSITGANIRDDGSQFLVAMQAQGGAYTLETISPDGVCQYEKITSITEILPWMQGLENILEAGADDATQIISFTVTEGGYYLDNNVLDLRHPDIVSDLEKGTLKTIYGVIAAIVERRKTPVTLLSCDNLRSNGERFQTSFMTYLAAQGNQDLIQWVQQNTTCPSCMVDRITPRPTPEVVARVEAATGEKDPCAVMGEQFIQWVIEDKFINGRPAWEKVGAEMVKSVHAYEEAKIRILNASHSVIAWAGTVKGFKYIHEGVVDQPIADLVRAYVLEDVLPCLEPSPLDLKAYLNMVIDRFRNAALLDTNQRVAADSFSKVPGFILPTLKTRVETKGSISATARIVAAFFVFLEMLNKGKVPFEYYDPAYEPARLKAMMSAQDPLLEFCKDPALWWDLAGHEVLVAEVKNAYGEVSKWLKCS